MSQKRVTEGSEREFRKIEKLLYDQGQFEKEKIKNRDEGKPVNEEWETTKTQEFYEK